MNLFGQKPQAMTLNTARQLLALVDRDLDALLNEGAVKLDQLIGETDKAASGANAQIAQAATNLKTAQSAAEAAYQEALKAAELKLNAALDSAQATHDGIVNTAAATVSGAIQKLANLRALRSQVPAQK